MELLSYWLIVVTALSILGAVLGFVSPVTLQQRQFAAKPEQGELTSKVYDVTNVLQ